MELSYAKAQRAEAYAGTSELVTGRKEVCFQSLSMLLLAIRKLNWPTPQLSTRRVQGV
jgi:hypothetical protein